MITLYKMLLLLLCTLFCSAAVLGLGSKQTTYNSFTNKLDYIMTYNLSDFAPAGGSGTGNVSGAGHAGNITKWGTTTTMTDAVFTELSIARASNCSGENSTHYSVPQNLSWTGSTCVYVAKNPGSGSSSANGNTTGGGATGTLTQWYNETQIISLTYAILYGNISGNLGNWSTDKSSYVPYSHLSDNGNWSSDRSNYINSTALQNFTIARAGNCTAVDNLTHISVVQNISNTGVSCVLVAKNPGSGTGGGGGTGIANFSITLMNGSGQTFTNNSQSYFQNLSGMLLSYNQNGTWTWAPDMSYIGRFFTNGTAGGGTGNITGGGAAGTLTQWYNETQITSLTYGILYGNISGNLGNWSSDKSSYVPYTHLSDNGNWSADKASYSTTAAGDQRWLGLSSSGWINISGRGTVGLANNNTNVTIGTVALFVNTQANKTSVNTTNPGATFEVNGDLNATTLRQGALTVCLSDGTNCVGIKNGTVTSIATSTHVSGGTITTSGTISLNTSGVTAAPYGNASYIPTFGVDANGIVYTAANVSIDQLDANVIDYGTFADARISSASTWNAKLGPTFGGWTNVSTSEMDLNNNQSNVSIGYIQSNPQILVDVSAGRIGFATRQLFDELTINGSVRIMTYFNNFTNLSDSTVNNTATHINLSNLAMFPSTGTILVENEAMSYENLSNNLTVTRAALGTTNVTHAIGVTVIPYLFILAKNLTQPTFVNLADGRTGINTSTPQNALEVKGVANFTTILQGIKTVCLSDGTNCPVSVNASRGGNVSGGFATNCITKGSNSTDLTCGAATDTGTLVTITSNVSIGGIVNVTGNTAQINMNQSVCKIEANSTATWFNCGGTIVLGVGSSGGI